MNGTVQHIIDQALALPQDERLAVITGIRLGAKDHPSDPLVARCYTAAETVLGISVGHRSHHASQVRARTLTVKALADRGYSVREISRNVGIERSNVYSHLHRLDDWQRYPFAHREELRQLEQFEQLLKS